MNSKFFVTAVAATALAIISLPSGSVFELTSSAIAAPGGGASGAGGTASNNGNGKGLGNGGVGQGRGVGNGKHDSGTGTGGGGGFDGPDGGMDIDNGSEDPCFKLTGKDYKACIIAFKGKAFFAEGGNGKNGKPKNAVKKVINVDLIGEEEPASAPAPKNGVNVFMGN